MAATLRSALLPPSTAVLSPVPFNVPFTVNDMVLRTPKLCKYFGDVPGGFVVYAGVHSQATPDSYAYLTTVFVALSGSYTVRIIASDVAVYMYKQQLKASAASRVSEAAVHADVAKYLARYAPSRAPAIAPRAGTPTYVEAAAQAAVRAQVAAEGWLWAPVAHG
eukprot:219303-Prymnesium_polylepis.1